MLCCAPACYARNATNYEGVPLCPGHFERLLRYFMPPEKPRKGAFKSPSVVYYVTSDARPGQVKIGTSVRLETRLSELSECGRYQVTVLATERGDVSHERARHREFGKLRLDGEWFTLDWPLTHHIEKLAQAERRRAANQARAKARSAAKKQASAI